MSRPRCSSRCGEWMAFALTTPIRSCASLAKCKPDVRWQVSVLQLLPTPCGRRPGAAGVLLLHPHRGVIVRRTIVLLSGVAIVACSQGRAAPAPAPQQSSSPATQAAPAQAPADTARKLPPGPGSTSTPNADPFPSTYTPYPSRTTLIRNATIMTAAGPTIRGGSILLRDGKIVAVGAN